MSIRSASGLLVFGSLWLAVILFGYLILEQEEFTPTVNGRVSANFPLGSALPLDANKPTLLVFVHPYCPCSRASLHELDRMMAETQNKLSVMIIFTIPKGLPPGWEEGDLWKFAAVMPGIRVFRDQAGREAVRFGVKGSGHALLYATSGRLLFSGGLTPSRGHEGDSPGHSAIVGWVVNNNSSISQSPVFGCSLL